MTEKQALKALNEKSGATKKKSTYGRRKVTSRSSILEATNSELRFQELLLDNALAFIVAIENDGTTITMNKTMLHSLGYAREEIVGTDYVNTFVPEDYRGSLRELFRTIVEKGEVTRNENPVVGKAGDIFFLEWMGQPVFHKESGKSFFLGVGIDITERKRMEEELRKRYSYERVISHISAIALQNPGLLEFHDKSMAAIGQVLNVSRSYLFEYSHLTDTVDNTAEWCAYGESPQKEILKGIPATDIPWWMQTLKKGQTICFSDIEDIPDEGAKKILRRQGILSILAVPLFVEGSFYGFMGFDECRQYREWPEEDVAMLLAMSRIISGVTERKEAEDSLRQSHERLKAVLDSIDAHVYIADMQTHEVLFHNAYGRKKWGDAVGKKCWNTFQRMEGGPCSFCTNDKLLTEDGKSAGVYKWEFQNTVNGHWYDCRDVAIQWTDGRMVRMEIAADITDRRRDEREKILLERRLAGIQKLESIGTLAGGVAHDFNNLLMGIQGYVSLMALDLEPSSRHYERLKHVQELVSSGADLTKQILGFARGGRYEVKPASMNDVVKKTASMFGRTRKEITIREKYGKGPCVAEVDRTQMEQVFMNLYFNALHAMPGGGEIHLETARVFLDETQVFYDGMKPGYYVKIVVRDNGIGIDDKTKERIFEPFFTTKAMGRGSGLGLATVYGIIKGHKGMIHVESEPGRGTSFTIHLPASKRKLALESAPDDIILRGNETILLVDDEKMILDVGREILEFLGYRVYAAGSGLEAIDIYREKRDEINMAIIDMIMPGVSGGETFDRLRRINPSVKVLLASGYGIEGEARKIISRGCDGFIQKPFLIEQLSLKIREVLD
ncbi:MAG: PAS domain S-box protein [Syntrophales bacterium]|nr:PAS domain S-box protein [Syntrophales bacterium]